jgi:hypothetical protein
MGRKCSPSASRHRQPFVRCTFPNQGKIQPVLARTCDLSCSDSPGCERRHREYDDPVIVREHWGCRMGSLVAMPGRIGSYSDIRRTIDRGFGLGLSVVVITLPIGWFCTGLRCGASSGVGTIAERFSLDRLGSQIEKFIDFGSYYVSSMVAERLSPGFQIHLPPSPGIFYSSRCSHFLS